MRILHQKYRTLLTTLAFMAVAATPGKTAFADHHIDSDRVISVSGHASTRVEPDLVTIRFGLETQQQTAGEALEDNAGVMDEVVRTLQKTGIDKDEISTSRFSVQAVYDHYQEPNTGRHRQVLTGYRVSNMLVVLTEKLHLVAPVIDNAVAGGVNRVDGVQFLVSPDILAELKEGLIEQAVLNARSKAEKALAPLGQVIIGVKTLSLADHAVPRPMRMEMAADSARSAPTQIFSSEQEISTNVQVTFLIGDKP